MLTILSSFGKIIFFSFFYVKVVLLFFPSDFILCIIFQGMKGPTGVPGSTGPDGEPGLTGPPGKDFFFLKAVYACYLET